MDERNRERIDHFGVRIDRLEDRVTTELSGVRASIDALRAGPRRNTS